MTHDIRRFVILTLLILGAIFIAQNTSVVEINFLFWHLAMSRALMIIFLLLLGISIGWLLHGHFSKSAQKETKPAPPRHKP